MKKRLGMDSILREEKSQRWESIGNIKICKSKIWTSQGVKSLPTLLTPFLKYHKDIANLTG